ncbi:hypothetical protein GCM10008014_14820 [Paenibacillus silvae]|uniref:Uncharacterized protein n=1 Tax=Paenibacillus silvae TaxID=1325358 RepID=A0ABQ1Z7G4_9BACL|nr:hypothetical protein GCM10008014_14820 [Paenibacillus silvae]
MYRFDEQGIRNILFRGRNRKSDSASIFTNAEMWAPQSGYSSHGRYNAISKPGDTYVQNTSFVKQCVS